MMLSWCITCCCPPQGRELLQSSQTSTKSFIFVAVPRRGTSCYLWERGMAYTEKLLSPAGARAVTNVPMVSAVSEMMLLSPAGARAVTSDETVEDFSFPVAVPRRGASCYSKNAKNTMRIFGIPTIFLYYLLYFCVSIRDIVGFPRCEPACNNLIYCYYNTRFAPNQPVSKPSSIATGCKTQRHKL